MLSRSLSPDLLGFTSEIRVALNWLPVIEIMIRLSDALRTWRKWLSDVNVETQDGIYKNNKIIYKCSLKDSRSIHLNSVSVYIFSF